MMISTLLHYSKPFTKFVESQVLIQHSYLGEGLGGDGSNEMDEDGMDFACT